jgi:hypothetical protein
MQKMGLTTAELRSYHRALVNDHTRSIRIEVLNLDGESLASITPTFLSGQVVINRRADIRRVLTLQFSDPGHALNFDSESPGDGVLYADRMLRVYDTIRYVDPTDGQPHRVTCIPFTGPVVRFQRTGDIVDVEAHGKERLASGEMWRPLTIKKRTKKTDAIRTIMEDRAGESRFSFPTVATRMPKTRSLDRFASPWKHARRIARSMDRQLYYTGPGVLKLRELPSTPLFTFNTGPHGEITSDVAISNDLDNLRNVVLVVGGKPKGAKRRVRAKAIAPPNHPLSPERLGRNGQPLFRVERIEDDSLRSRKECQRKANRVLEDRLRSVITAAFQSVPIPHLEEGDLIRVRTDGGVITTRFDEGVLPLHTEGDASMRVGYIENTYPRRRRIRRR